MQIIYKYKINPRIDTIDMPEGAEILTVALQNDDLYLWAKVDPTQEPRTRHFHVVGTGTPLPELSGVNYQYLGTVYPSVFVFHVFEKITD